MDLGAVQKVYRRYAPRYDFYFGAMFQPGRREIVTRMDCHAGDRILEVGVGTGISLSLYPRYVEVTGIDLSREMLARARVRRQRERLNQVVALRRMDAENMDFPDDSFDKVVAMYVMSVTPNPEKLLGEMRRVCKPGGGLFIVNHFQHENTLVRGVERLVSPLSNLMGFHPDFPMDRLLRESGLEVAAKVPVNALGYWTLLHCHNTKSASKNTAPRQSIA